MDKMLIAMRSSIMPKPASFEGSRRRIRRMKDI
jgi:hypothetical protein